LLIKAQQPDATKVAGFWTWQNEFDHHVKKGEDAIWIGAETAEDVNFQQIQRVQVDCRIKLLPLHAGVDSGLVDGDPRLLSNRRVRLAVGQAMRPLRDRAVRALDSQQLQDGDGLPNRQPRSAETHSKPPHESRCALVLPDVLMSLVHRID
jgi:hypothetical protein